MIYCLNTNDDLVSYDSHSNPFRIVKIQELTSNTKLIKENANHEVFNCAQEGSFYKYIPGTDHNADSRIMDGITPIRDFLLFTGTLSGYTDYLLKTNLLCRCKHGRQTWISLSGTSFLRKAHSAAVNMLRYDEKKVLLLSAGAGMPITNLRSRNENLEP
jgi:hypothetical protein